MLVPNLSAEFRYSESFQSLAVTKDKILTIFGINLVADVIGFLCFVLKL